MAKNTDFYRGRRQRRNYWLIPFVLLLGIITLLVVLFYGVQKYATITDDGVKVVFSDSKTEAEPLVSNSESEEMVFETVVPEIVFEAPDYSRIEATAGRNVKPLRAIYLNAGQISLESLQDAAGKLVDGTALMLEMKPRSGNLMWYSNAKAALDYGLSVQNEVTNSIQRYVDMLKEKNIYLVAQISCCVDERYPAYSSLVALKTASGMNYYDDIGMWLDPYSQKVRDYVVEMARELYDMGFDEVVLADLRHPVPDEDRGEVEFVYNAEMSTLPSAEGGISGFAISVAQQLSDREKGKVLSIYSYTPVSLVKADTGTGQNTPLFFKLYDRVYYPTDRGTYTYNLQDVTRSITETVAASRFVPVVQNYLPDNPDKISWVLIDVEED